MRTYTELLELPSFEERLQYLMLEAAVGEETFGWDRILNQQFYHSDDWKSLRKEIIARDMGCDLGVPGWEIFGRVIIHHMNPIRLRDVLYKTDYLLNPEYLICVSGETHSAIHYGGMTAVDTLWAPRTQNDTCPWRQISHSHGRE